MSTEPYDFVRKRIIICCDGTWQSSVSGERNIPSNVTRLCRHLAPEGVTVEEDPDTHKEVRTLWKQITFYDAGIGTGDLGAIDVLRQGGTGAGLAQNVIEAYNFLVMNYSPGDRIYCFGFSRGAYTARSLSGFITQFGVCSKMDLMAFPVLYDLYEAAVPEPKTGSEREADRKLREKLYGKYNKDTGVLEKEGFKHVWLRGGRIDVNSDAQDTDDTKLFTSGTRHPIPNESRHVEVVGVWDTVGSLGVPKIFGIASLQLWLLNKPGRQFHDVRINENVHHAFHALALDERRLPFSPTLWWVDKKQKRPKGSSFKQVWFPGVHINCGGGSNDILNERKSDFEQLANITFAWMVEQCRPHLAFDDESLKLALADQEAILTELESKPVPIHGKWYQKLSMSISRALLSLFGSKPANVQVERGWALGRVVDSFLDGGLSMWLGWRGWRTPGELSIPTSVSDPNAVNPQDCVTDESIHPTVFYRMQKLNKKPPALKGWERRPYEDPATKERCWMWQKGDTGAKMPEYRIASANDHTLNLERRVAEAGHAGEYLRKLDAWYDHGIDKTILNGTGKFDIEALPARI